jgi:hypothetical protein
MVMGRESLGQHLSHALPSYSPMTHTTHNTFTVTCLCTFLDKE